MSQPSKGGKELRIVTVPVVTVDDVKQDKRKLKLLHILDWVGELSEKGIVKLLYTLKEKGIDLGYNFIMIGDEPSSREVLEDARILLYLDLAETNPMNRKVRLTSIGKEFLEANKLPDEEIDDLRKAVDEVKERIKAEDNVSTLPLMRGRRRRRRRF